MVNKETEWNRYLGKYTLRETAQRTGKNFSIKGNKNLEQFGQKKKKGLGSSLHIILKQIPDKFQGQLNKNTKLLIKP